MRLILFDIDGTLLWTDGAGRRAVGRALREEVGTSGPIDTYRLDGKTDPLIVRELLELAGHVEASQDRARVEAICHRYLVCLEQELAAARNATRVFPGVREVLQALEPAEREGRALVGLLTGNLERGAALKLQSAGLAPERFAVGAYGSDSGVRSELPAIAARRASQRTGRAFAGPDVVILGDTPADVHCGRPIGARAIGVATGHYDRDALREAGAAAVFADLADTAAVLDALFA
jgi:phosphoglycolate phosphatase-like HAD superfamily hydrolase